MNDEFKKDDELHEDDFSSHEYDGIKELDNKAPLWIVILFLLTIGFAGIYAIQYFGHPNNNMDQTSEYNRKVAEYEASKKLLQNELSAGDGMNMDEMIAAGATLYAEKGCIACHGMKGEGNQIGPNLTDNFWLNGCSTDDLIKIITEGKPEKGMTPYKTMMSENQIKNVSTYILHALVGSNPDNGKAAQGEECTVN